MKLLRSLMLFALAIMLSRSLAQMSDSLYKALPDSLKPKRQSALSEVEKQRVLSYVDYYISTKNSKELNKMAHLMEEEYYSTRNQDLKIRNSKSLADFYITDTHLNYSTNAQNPSNLHKALSYYKRTINLIGTNKIYLNMLAQSYLGIGNFFLQNHQYDSLVEYLHPCLEVAKLAKDTDVLVQLNQKYALMYSQLSLPKLAISYDKEALRLYPTKQRWDDEYTRIMINAAIHYLVAFNADPKRENLDSALNMVYSIMEAKKLEAADWYGACYYILGLCFARNGEYLRALPLLDSSMLQVYNQTSKYWPNYQYGKYIQKAACLMKVGRYAEGKKLMDSVNISETDFRTLKLKADVLYGYAVHINDWKGALEHYKEYIADADSLNTMAFQGKVFESEQKYQILKKEAAIEKLQNETLEAKSKGRGMAIIFLTILLLLGTSLSLSYLKGRSLSKKNALERESMKERFQKMENEMALQQARQITENAKALSLLRSNISQHMHDEVSSSLAALRFVIKDYWLTAEHPETKKVLASVEEEANGVYSEMRIFMHRLQETDTTLGYNVCGFLHNLGLNFGKGSSLHIKTEFDDGFIQENFTATQHAETYLFIKEAVANCMKHAEATDISIKIGRVNDTVQVNINDNGKGIAYANQGLGLKSMQARMGALAGTLRYWNDNGLYIIGTFPLNGHQIVL